MFKALENHFVSFLLIIALAALTTLTAFPTLTTPTAHAAVPHYLGYEGYLTDTSDNAITNTYSLTFRIYDAVTAGSLLWTETHSSVTVTKGYFSVQLGSVTALNLDFEDPYWISFQVASDVEMTPRQPINSVGSAYFSDNTYALTDADLDTTIDANTNDQIDIAIAGADDFQFVANILKVLAGSSMETDTINETNAGVGVTIDNVTLKGETNTYNITNGTAILDVAADSILDVDANLTVESASFINQDLTTDASVAFTGLSNTDANITAVGDIALDSISSAGDNISIAATNSTDILQIGDGSYTWGHAPMVGIEGILEVDGVSYFDGTGIFSSSVQMGNKQRLFFGGTIAVNHTVITGDTTTDQFGIYLGSEQGRQVVIGETGTYSKDYAHAVQTDPTIFIHSALDPTTDNGEYLGLSYLGLSGGTMETNRPTFDLTLQSVAPFGTALGANGDGADIILQTSSPAGEGTLYGVTSVGANTNSHTISDTANSLFVDGKFEVDGISSFDGTIGTYGLQVFYDGATDVGYVSGEGDDGIHISPSGDGKGNHNLILTTSTNYSLDHDHDTLSTNPTMFIHSALTPDTDNGEYLGLSYLGLSGGTMQTDRTTFDMTLQSVAPFGTALGANQDGADIILQTSSPTNGGAVYGVTSVGANSNSWTIDAAADSLFVSGRLEVDGNVYFDSALTMADTKPLYFGTAFDSVMQHNTFQGPHALLLGVGAESNNFIIAERLDNGYNFAHAQQTNPTIYIQSANQVADEWISFTHNQADGVITTGKGAITLAPATGIVQGIANTAWVFQQPDQGTNTNAGVGLTINADDGGTGTTGGKGGDIRITAGDAKGSDANAGGILRLDGGTKTGAGAAGYVSVGTGAPGHTPDEDSLYVEGILEVNGTAYFDSSVTVSSLGTGATSFNTYWIFGAAAAGYGGMKYNADDGSYLVVGTTDNAGNRHMIFTDASNWSKNHGHDTLSANPTMFIHSATDPTSDGKENLAISWNTLQMADEGATISNANAFSILGADGGTNGAGGTGGNITITAGAAQGSGDNAGGILRLDGGVKTGDGVAGYVSIGTPAARATTDEDSLFVAGGLEVDGLAYLDGGINTIALVSTGSSYINSNVNLYFGTSAESRIQYSTTQTPSTLAVGMSTESNSVIFGATSDIASYDFAHAQQTNPTIYIQSANQVADEWISFTHNQADGVITTGKGAITLAPATGIVQGIANTAWVFQQPDQGANTNAGVGITINADDGGSGTTGGKGGDIRVTAGDAKGSDANAGGILRLDGGTKTGAGAAGYVSVGTGAPGHTPDEDSLYVHGILEVNGSTHLDGALYATSASVFGISESSIMYFGGAASNTNILTGSATTDQLTLALGSGNGRQLVIGDYDSYTKDYDHATATNPTMFIHSVLDPTTDNGEYLGLSYLGLSGGTMQTDRTTFDMTLQSVAPFGTALGANQDGADIILQTSSPTNGGAVYGVTSVGANGNGHSIDDTANSLFVDGKLEVNGNAYLDAGQTGNVTQVNAATYDLLVTDYILAVDYTGTGAVTLTLPTAQCNESTDTGREIHIVDTGGGAGANNITIDTQGEETISGANTQVINANYNSYSITCYNSKWYLY